MLFFCPGAREMPVQAIRYSVAGFGVEIVQSRSDVDCLYNLNFMISLLILQAIIKYIVNSHSPIHFSNDRFGQWRRRLYNSLAATRIGFVGCGQADFSFR